jgi:cyclic pyranopterin phosphate synthase
MSKLTHVDNKGNANMVDVSSKNITSRYARAVGVIIMNEEAKASVEEHTNKKGDVLTVAQVAGIMGAKKTSDLIPLSHNISLTNAKVFFESIDGGYKCISEVKCEGQTGVEMEALTAVSVALLTVYDMAKAVDKRMVIKEIHLEEKSGGKSGDFKF